MRTKLPQWIALKKHQRDIAQTHLRELFAQDPERQWYAAPLPTFTPISGAE